MEQVGYQIVHSIAGRIRIRVPWLETEPQAASTYQRLVEGLSGVKVVRVNPLAQSIVVEYSARAVSVPKMEELLISTMQQVKLTPPAAAPTVEQEPEPKSKTPTSREPIEINISESIPEPLIPTETPLEQNVDPATSHSRSKQPVIPEIPSPWDEEVREQNPISTSEETATSMIDNSTPIPKCSTALLAKRLKVTSQAITRRRTKSDFAQWTQAQDPEGIAWNYDEHDRSFCPVSSTFSNLE